MARTEAQKGKAIAEKMREKREFLDRRVGQLHRLGYQGRAARDQADLEWAEQVR